MASTSLRVSARGGRVPAGAAQAVLARLCDVPDAALALLAGLHSTHESCHPRELVAFCGLHPPAALPDGQDERGEQCAPRSASNSRARARPSRSSLSCSSSRSLMPDHAIGKAVHRLLLAAAGLALDDAGAQQHAQCAGVAEGATPVRGHAARQRRVQSPMRSAVKWLIRGRGPSRSVRSAQAGLLRCRGWGLRARHAGDSIVSSRAHLKTPCRVRSHSASSRPATRSPASAPSSPRSHICARVRCTSARRCAAGRRAAAPRTRSCGTGPYYEWGHLEGGKRVHRVVTPQQAQLLQQAIDNQRHAKKLMRAWKEQTERLIDLQAPRQP